MPRNQREPGRSVASRLLAILDAYGPDDSVLSLAQIYHRSGLAPSTAHRLAQSLVAWGGLERTDDGGYRLGLRLFELGTQALGQRELYQRALPFMRLLHEVTHESVHLGVLEGSHGIWLAKLSGRGAVRAPSRSGGRLPAHATGTGKALLAFAPDDTVADVVSHGLHRYTPFTITSPGALRRNLSQVRDRGIAVSAREYSLATASVAAPILDRDGRTLAALSLVMPSTRPDRGRHTHALRHAALDLSRALQRHAPLSPATPG